MTNAAQPANLSTDGSSDAAPPTVRPWWFYLVAGAAVLYCGFLIGLAIYTSFFSSPIVLNTRQLSSSPLIVTATLESGSDEGSKLRIRQVWKGRLDAESIFVRDLPASRLAGGDEWIVPLTPVSTNIFLVTPLRYQAKASGTPLIYPADSATADKLKSLLSSDKSSL